MFLGVTCPKSFSLPRYKSTPGALFHASHRVLLVVAEAMRVLENECERRRTRFENIYSHFEKERKNNYICSKTNFLLIKL